MKYVRHRSIYVVKNKSTIRASIDAIEFASIDNESRNLQKSPNSKSHFQGINNIKSTILTIDNR